MKQKLTMRPASSSRLPAKVTYRMSFRRLTKSSRGPQNTPLLRVLGWVSEGSLMSMCRELCPLVLNL